MRTSYDEQIAGPLARLTGNLLGWNLGVRGQARQIVGAAGALATASGV